MSEGQAYGMLVAVAIGDEKRFRRMWRGRDEHLQRDDGLLAWRWAAAASTTRAAADADLDAARALLSPGAVRRPDYRRAGLRIGPRDRRTDDRSAEPRTRRRALGARPRVVDPSYFSPRAFVVLARRRPRRDHLGAAPAPLCPRRAAARLGESRRPGATPIGRGDTGDRRGTATRRCAYRRGWLSPARAPTAGPQLAAWPELR